MSWCWRNWFCDLLGAFLVVVVLAWVLSMPLWAAVKAEPPDWTTIYPAAVGRIIDGDTFEATVMVWPGTFVTTKVRIFGIDTPELHAHLECERKLAEQAKVFAEKQLAAGDVTIEQVLLDKYGGRHVAVVKVGGKELGGMLIKEGLAVPYLGGEKRMSWCS